MYCGVYDGQGFKDTGYTIHHKNLYMYLKNLNN